jgi:hypothetical protein
MGQHTNRKSGHAMNEKQNKISGCVCSGMLFAAVHESAAGTNGRANRAVECLMLGVDRKTCALREHFAF